MALRCDDQGLQDQVRVVQVDPLADPRWGSFVAQQPGALIYHDPAWLSALEREYQRKPLGLVCEDGTGTIRGVLALCHTRGVPLRAGGQLSGRRLSSLPRTPVSGPLALDRDAAAALVQAAVDRARMDGTQLQIKVASTELDGIADGLIRIPWRQSYILELSEDPDRLGPKDGRARRRNNWAVGKAKRLGVEVRRAETEEDLRAWHHLYLLTMRHLAVPARPYRFFRALWETLGPRGSMRLLVAEQVEGGRATLLAGSCFLLFGQTVTYAFTGWRREARLLRANDLIHWYAIQDACREGYRRYDFGEVAAGRDGLAAFKSKWGTQPVPLYRYHFPAPTRIEADPTGGRWATVVGAAWRRLPLWATARLGDWLYSYL